MGHAINIQMLLYTHIYVSLVLVKSIQQANKRKSKKFIIKRKQGKPTKEINRDNAFQTQGL